MSLFLSLNLLEMILMLSQLHKILHMHAIASPLPTVQNISPGYTAAQRVDTPIDDT